MIHGTSCSSVKLEEINGKRSLVHETYETYWRRKLNIRNRFPIILCNEDNWNQVSVFVDSITIFNMQMAAMKQRLQSPMP